MFKNSPKIFNHYKSDFPENTIRRIVSGFRNLGLDVCYKPHYESRGVSPIQSGSVYINHTRLLTNGKGVSPVLCEASAWAEMAERFSSALILNFLYYGDLTFVFPRDSLFWDLLERHPAVYRSFHHREFLKGYEYQGEVISPDSPPLKNWHPLTPEDVSLLYDHDLLQHRAEAYSLLEDRMVKVPFKLIDLLSSSNGLASGNTLEEAFVQGAMEVFERHALFSVLLSQQSCPTVDPGTIRDDEIQNYIGFFKSINIKVIVKDFSLGGKMPVVGVIFENKNIEGDSNLLKRAYWHRRLNVGAHFNRVEALKRCFTEGMQGYSLEEFQFHRRLDPLWRFWHERMGKAIEKPLYPLYFLFANNNYGGDKTFLDEGVPVIGFDDLIEIRHEDFIDDIGEIISICKKNGWKVYAIDHTHPILRFPSLRVVVPPISYVLPYMYADLRFRDQLPPKEGVSMLSMHIPRNWCPTMDDVIKLKDIIEWYVSGNLIVYNMLTCNRYSTLNAFRILSVAHLILGNFVQAQQYADFLQELNMDADIVEVVKTFCEKREAPPLSLMEKTLFDQCECVDCLIRFPQTIHKMVASFYHS